MARSRRGAGLEENERLRAALLSSVSTICARHWLRSSAPPARCVSWPAISEDDRRQLLDGILAESERLNHISEPARHDAPGAGRAQDRATGSPSTNVGGRRPKRLGSSWKVWRRA
ncbi:hypothetical protein DSL92_07250 [Billgrantia gudaonensis]|uniref:Uncharacterized protein n=1 Tax=Billgrantia gudaonensis TaxID=376427 RepID=A0A3S0NEJ7_9GAMM|nr:hypothetical protein DSL92_07250 [Halomonas gudaonensis]